ncbi:ANTAR domain-containing protein [Streptomyces nogalater]
MRTAPVIGMAQGVLMVRYGLPDSGAAFRALRETSQRFNVPLRVLVSAVVVARAPNGEVWFPGRRPARAAAADPGPRRPGPRYRGR